MKQADAPMAGPAAGRGSRNMVVVWLYSALAIRFPDETLIGWGKRLLGPWLGSAVAGLYLWYSLHMGSLVRTPRKVTE
jgi:hypothetical protein